MNNFKRCPIQPLPGEGVLCQSCQRRIVIKPCPAQHKVIPVCIPLHKPIKQRINGKRQEIYPILERTSPSGKPIPSDLLQENYLDSEFQEICNLYLSEFTAESPTSDEQVGI